MGNILVSVKRVWLGGSGVSGMMAEVVVQTVEEVESLSMLKETKRDGTNQAGLGHIEG